MLDFPKSLEELNELFFHRLSYSKTTQFHNNMTKIPENRLLSAITEFQFEIQQIERNITPAHLKAFHEALIAMFRVKEMFDRYNCTPDNLKKAFSDALQFDEQTAPAHLQIMQKFLANVLEAAAEVDTKTKPETPTEEPGNNTPPPALNVRMTPAEINFAQRQRQEDLRRQEERRRQEEQQAQAQTQAQYRRPARR